MKSFLVKEFYLNFLKKVKCILDVRNHLFQYAKSNVSYPLIRTRKNVCELGDKKC